jgi:hypothetical protein
MPTTESHGTLTAAQHRGLYRRLERLHEVLQALHSDSDPDAALTIVGRATLLLARIRIAMDAHEFAVFDWRQLNDRSLASLKRDPAVPLSTKREIGVLLQIRRLERMIDSAFRGVEDAGCFDPSNQI